MSTYTATVTREGSTWFAQCDQEPTAHTWAPTLAALRHEIVDAVILDADLPDDADVTVRLVAGEGLSQDLADALALSDRRAELRDAQAVLQADTLASVHNLIEAGYSVRDVAGAVGLTPGRIAQIA